MKLTEPNQVFPMLWEFISGEKATARHSLSLLESHFKTPSPGRETWSVHLIRWLWLITYWSTRSVVLVDELDQLVTKKNDVIYNFFNWPNQPHSKLIVIAIANTMDLPERYFSSKIRSRLGMSRHRNVVGRLIRRQDPIASILSHMITISCRRSCCPV